MNARISALSTAQYRRHRLDPKREGLEQAARRRFWVGLSRMKRGIR